MTAQKRQTELLSVIALFVLLVFQRGFTGQGWDDNFFLNWCQYIQAHGLANTYGSGTDYLPFYQYILWLFVKLCGSDPATIALRLPYLHAFTLAFDFAGLYMVYRWIDRRLSLLAVLVLSLGNLGYSYNTLIFGQVDAIWAALGFGAMYFSAKGRVVPGAMLIVLALAMKLQAIILLPVWCLVTVDAIIRMDTKRAIGQLGGALLAAITTAVLVLTPFAFGDGGLGAVKRVIFNSVGGFPILSLSAYNAYWILWDVPNLQRDDWVIWHGLNYRQIGLLIFGLSSLLAMLPLIIHVIRNLLRPLRERRALKRELIWISAALVCILFFYCNTEMHERYSHTAIIFLTAYAFYARRWWAYLAYLLFSLVYFLNLEVVVHHLQLSNYKGWLFEPRVIATLYFIDILWLAGLLVYHSTRRHTLAFASPAV